MAPSEISPSQAPTDALVIEIPAGMSIDEAAALALRVAKAMNRKHFLECFSPLRARSPGHEIKASWPKDGDIFEGARVLRGGKPSSVAFTFNDVVLVAEVRPFRSTSAAEIVAAFHARKQSRTADKRVLDQLAERRRQDAYTACIRQFQDVVGDRPRLIEWLVTYAALVVGNSTAQDEKRIVAGLKAAGYSADAHVGRPAEDFKDPDLLAEYTIGQAMRCIGGAGPLHLVNHFGRQYLEMVRPERTPNP